MDPALPATVAEFVLDLPESRSQSVDGIVTWSRADVPFAALGPAGIEIRRRLNEVPGELRGYLTVVPETRWIKHTDNLRFFLEETIDHYSEHSADLEAILDAAAAATAAGDDAPDDLVTQKARDAD